MVPVTSEVFAARFPGMASDLDGAQLETLLASFELNEVGADEYVIAEWTTSDALFLVWDGELEALTDTPEGDRQLGLIGAGELLGDVSLLDPGPATASVYAPQGCTVLRLSRSSFDELRATEPAIASAVLRQLLRSLAARVRSATRQLEDLLTGTSGTEASDDELLAVHRSLYARTAAGVSADG